MFLENCGFHITQKAIEGISISSRPFVTSNIGATNLDQRNISSINYKLSKKILNDIEEILLNRRYNEI